jgi:hypothetical protein
MIERNVDKRCDQVRRNRRQENQRAQESRQLPQPSTSVMLLLGFAGIGFMA